MAANFYLVQLAESTSLKPLGANALIVCAESEAEAKDIAASKFSYDSDSAWQDATVSLMDPAADLTGLQMVVQVVRTAGVTSEFRYTAQTAETWDDMVTAIAVIMAAVTEYNGTINFGSATLRLAAANSLGAKVVHSWVEFNGVRITDMDPVIDATTTAGTKRDIVFDESLLKPSVISAVTVLE